MTITGEIFVVDAMLYSGRSDRVSRLASSCANSAIRQPGLIVETGYMKCAKSQPYLLISTFTVSFVACWIHVFAWLHPGDHRPLSHHPPIPDVSLPRTQRLDGSRWDSFLELTKSVE